MVTGMNTSIPFVGETERVSRNRMCVMPALNPRNPESLRFFENTQDLTRGYCRLARTRGQN